jgi:hypothetical protein
MPPHRRFDGLMWLAVLGSLAWLLSPGLVSSQVPAFRDAYHFYYPQAVWLDTCVSNGNWFPTWNHQEGQGVSVSGQPSSALYYPLRVLWHIPSLDVAQRFSIVIGLHLFLAVLGIRLAAKRLGLSNIAAWMSAIAYGLSGPIAFQHTNLIYLCSAAWVGFYVACVLRGVSSNSWQQWLGWSGGGLCLGLMLLSGDPHTAINLALLTALVLISLGIREGLSTKQVTKATTTENAGRRSHGGRRHTSSSDNRSRRSSSRNRPALQPLGRQAIGWVLAITVCLAVTPMQWLPALRWSLHSQRANPAADAAQVDSEPITSVLADVTPPAPSTYDFSLSPWHVLTFFAPTLGGHYLPDNSRLFDAIPAEGRMWVPSLFMGTLPAVLMLTGLGRMRRFPLMSGLVVTCFAFSLGHYWLFWLLRELIIDLGAGFLASWVPASQIISPYWLLTWLPGYDMLRYPAKWTVPMMAAGSLLAGQVFDDWFKGDSRSMIRADRLRQLARRLIILYGVAVAVMLGCLLLDHRGGFENWQAYLSQACADAWLGAPQSEAIWGSLMFAFAIPLFALLIFNWLDPRALSGQSLFPLLLLVEVTVVNSPWFIYTNALPASKSLTASPPEQRSASEIPVRCWANTARPNLHDDFEQHPAAKYVDSTRLQADYQHQFLLGKLATLHEVDNFGAMQSIRPRVTSQLINWLQRHDSMQPHQPEVDRLLSELGVTHRLVRHQVDGATEFSWQEIADPAPLCELTSAKPGSTSGTKHLEWQWTAADSLSIEVHADQACRVICRQLNDGGWRAIDPTRNATFRIADQKLFIEISLPAGEHNLQLYRRW